MKPLGVNRRHSSGYLYHFDLQFKFIQVYFIALPQLNHAFDLFLPFSVIENKVFRSEEKQFVKENCIKWNILCDMFLICFILIFLL